MDVFNVRIYEADSPFYEGKLTSLIIPTADGSYGIQARHRNLVIATVPGIMKYRIPDDPKQPAGVLLGGGHIAPRHGAPESLGPA